MTAATIAEYLRVIPDSLLPALKGQRAEDEDDFDARNGYDPDTERFTLLYSEPKIGWKIAYACARYGIPLLGVSDSPHDAIFRAYLYCCNANLYRDPALQKAMSLHDSRMITGSRAVRALMFPFDSTVKAVAESLNLDEEVVSLYEQLFFNILDRKKDSIYLTKLIYPHGRTVEYMGRYVESASFESIMARSGFNNGAKDVMYLMGLSNNLVDSMASAESGKNLEQLMMAQGFVMARNGWLNQASNAVGITHARQLIAAGKIGGQDTGAGDSDFLYMADSWWAELERQKRLEHTSYVSHRLGISLETEDALSQA